MKVIFKGRECEIKDGAIGFDALKELSPESKKTAVAIKVNGKMEDLSAKLEEGTEIEFVDIASKEGFEVTNHSCAHLLAQAVLRLYPNSLFGYGPAVEEGFYYDIDFGEQTVSDADFPKIEQEMAKIVKENLPFRRSEVSEEEALSIFAANPYKCEHIKELQGPISVYRQGEFADLCRGPHVPSTGYLKHFKLLSLAGAYWKGDSKNRQLTRIYGTCQKDEASLKEYLEILQKRKDNDHRKIGKELGLFMISDYGPGFPFFLPKGMALKNELVSYWRQIHAREGYMEIETPTMLSRELWEISGHWGHYKDNMYTTKIDDKDFAIKPMNCPGAILTYNHTLHSYKDLPVRIGELGHVHRHEASGALNGLFRVRAFTQDDAHIFCRRDQLEEEIKGIMRLFDEVYSVFGLSYRIVLSTRPEDYIGEKEFWDESEAILARACEHSGHEYQINPGDGAFYGPKLDFKLKDSMNRTWQCGTIQLDVNLPHRFGCYYIDQNGEKVEPVMLHRVVFGSIERFIGILTENYGGAFPTWLAPIQARILPVLPESQGEYAHKLKDRLSELGFRVEVDDSQEKLGYRMRNAIVCKIPYSIVVGEKEKEEGLLTYRVLGEKEQKTVKVEEFIALLSDSVKNKKRF